MKITPRNLRYVGVVTNRPRKPASKVTTIEVDPHDKTSMLAAVGELMQLAKGTTLLGGGVDSYGDVSEVSDCVRVRVTDADPQRDALIAELRELEQSADAYKAQRARQQLDQFEQHGIRIGGTYAVQNGNRVGTTKEGDAIVVFKPEDIVAEIEDAGSDG